MPSSSSPANASLLPAYLLGLAGVAIFGATLPVTRLALADFDPWFLTFARSLIAAFLAIGLLLATGKRWRHPNPWQIFFAGLCLIFGFPGMMAIALQTVPAAHGGVVLGFLPLATAILAAVFAGERHSPAFWTLSAIGGLIVALYALLFSGEPGSTGISGGDLWMILAGLAAAVGYMIFGKLSRDTPGWEIICRALVLNLPLILIGCWATWDDRFADASTDGIVALAYLGVFSMFLGFCAWNVALAMGGIARIGQVQLLQTFFTLAFAGLLLGETIDAATLTAAIAITAIVALLRRL